MFEGIDKIRAAAEALATRDVDLKQRLVEAGEKFWAAAFHYPDWPPHLQERAEQIQSLILAQGTVAQTVPQMNPDAARQAAHEILRFMVEFEIAYRKASGEI